MQLTAGMRTGHAVRARTRQEALMAELMRRCPKGAVLNAGRSAAADQFLEQPERGWPNPPGLPFIQRSRARAVAARIVPRSEEHTSELQSLMRTSYAVFGWK